MNADHLLARRAVAGDAAAFEDIVRRYHKPVRAFLASRLDDPHAADDLAQDVFLAAHQSFRHFDPARPLTPWLRGIAMNCLRNHFRRARRTFPIEAISACEKGAWGSDAERGLPDALEALRECLDALGPQARELVHLRYSLEHGVDRICASTGRNHSTVTMALHRIRISLRACVEEKCGGPLPG